MKSFHVDFQIVAQPEHHNMLIKTDIEIYSYNIQIDILVKKLENIRN